MPPHSVIRTWPCPGREKEIFLIPVHRLGCCVDLWGHDVFLEKKNPANKAGPLTKQLCYLRRKIIRKYCTIN